MATEDIENTKQKENSFRISFTNNYVDELKKKYNSDSQNENIPHMIEKLFHFKNQSKCKTNIFSNGWLTK